VAVRFEDWPDDDKTAAAAPAVPEANGAAVPVANGQA
jgi:hypothetical protein